MDAEEIDGTEDDEEAVRRVMGEEGVEVREEEEEEGGESKSAGGSVTVQSSPDDLGDAEKEFEEECANSSDALLREDEELTREERGEEAGSFA